MTVTGYSKDTTVKRIQLSPPHLTGLEEAAVAEALRSNWVAPCGPQVDRLEQRFAELIGVRSALAVTSGTAAIHLALRDLALSPGDEVLCSSLTFCASANPIVYERAHPVFVDSDPSTWNLDANLLSDELKRASRVGKLPKAIIAVDIFGQSADIDDIVEIADRHGVPVLQDCAESLGASYKGRLTGGDGWASVFSLNGNKIITASGGGILCSDDADLVSRARFLASQAKDDAPYYHHTQIGFNYRMSNLLAAVANVQLSVLEQRVEARRQIRSWYKEHLDGTPGVTFMPESPRGQSNGWLTAILIDEEQFGVGSEHVRQSLERQGVESRRIWKPLHLQPVFAGARCLGGVVCKRIFKQGLCLPSGSAMTAEEVEHVANALKSASCRNHKAA